MLKTILFTLFTFCSSSFLPAQTIDGEKSVVNFTAVALKVNKVNGTFKGMKGEINFNENNLENSAFSVCIDPSTVNTKNQKRDDHLRSEDFFFIKNFPEICFVSTSIEKTKNGFKTTGNLALHGITKEIEIPFTFKNKTFTGNIKIKRLDYGIGVDYGSFTASKEAKIEIVCVLK